MLMIRRLTVCALLVSTLLAVVGCRHAPPNLTPQATAAFHAESVVKALDLVRDIAYSAQKNHVLSKATTRAVVDVHRTAVKTIDAVPNGWKPTVQSALDGLLTNKEISDAEKHTLAPYLALAKAAIQEIP